VFGVIRRDVLARTLLIDKYVGSDRVLLAELSLRGRLHEIPDYLFHRRDHPQASGRMYDMYKRLAWFDPAKRNHLNLVYWKMGYEFQKTIGRVNLPWPVKVSCYQTVVRWHISRHHQLGEDLKAAAVQVFPFSRSLVHAVKKLNDHNRINSGGGI
jgi:hypothetical protein